MAHRKPDPITAGMRFGKWTAIAVAPDYRGCRAWTWRCECGQERVIVSARVVNGDTRSCGCVSRAAMDAVNRAGVHRSRAVRKAMMAPKVIR